MLLNIFRSDRSSLHRYPFNADKYFDAAGKRKKKKEEAPAASFGLSLKDDCSVAGLNVEDSHSLMELFDRTPAEIGLDRQDYQCHGCTKAVGVIFGPAKVCAYTKRYYCDECHSDQSSPIPARIVSAWDLRPQRVCDKAKRFLDAVYSEPVINIKAFHTSIFSQLSPCPVAPVLTLRKKLHYMHIYLLTCRNQGCLPLSAVVRCRYCMPCPKRIAPKNTADVPFKCFLI